jgi:PKHD-type hydroxylase
MHYFIRPYDVFLPKFGVMNGAFSSEEVERITFLEELMSFEKGVVGPATDGGLNEKARNSDVSFIFPNEQSEWLYQKLGQLIGRANYDLFMYDIDRLEPLQYTMYKGDSLNHYDWHFDSFQTYESLQRKVSGVLCLSDPDEYEGGDLEIITSGSPDRAERLRPYKGEVVFFDSQFPHKVHPVTKGVRKTLVFWVLGRRNG